MLLDWGIDASLLVKTATKHNIDQFSVNSKHWRIAVYKLMYIFSKGIEIQYIAILVSVHKHVISLFSFCFMSIFLFQTANPKQIYLVCMDKISWHDD
jgi:hypothetical protein